MTNTNEPTFTYFEDVQPELGEAGDDYDSEVERLDDCYTRVCVDTPYTILARPGRQGEAQGLYAVTSGGGLQILGYSFSVDDEVRNLMSRAWELYLEGYGSSDAVPPAKTE